MALLNINFRAIPSVQELCQSPDFASYPIAKRYLKRIIQEEITQLRKLISDGKAFSPEQISGILKKRITSRVIAVTTPSLKRVINASGIILHTNMGRAPLPEAARQAMSNISENYSNLEIDLDSGKRGKRISHVESLLCLITGAESGFMVNNCAAAILLALNTLANRKEVPVSRGELVEIGGAFRMPDVMKSGGVKMVEIGTTNKTHLRDYEKAITPKTAALLKVHTSNYRVLGFTESVEIKALATLAKKHELPLIYDMGSGILENLQTWGYPYEPVVQDILAAGVDVVTFSGDKILGGPQAGIIVGNKTWLDKIKKNHLARALRCDKLIYAAMEASLRLYLSPEKLSETQPVARQLSLSQKELRSRAEALATTLQASSLKIEVIETFSQMGSGALPLEKIPSFALKITAPNKSPTRLSRKLREHSPPIIGYVQDEALFLNFRTIREDELEVLENALKTLGA